MEKQAAKLEKDLIIKELETLDFLEALVTTNNIIKDLKLKLKQKAAQRSIDNQEEHSYCNPLASPDQAKMNLMDEDKDFLGVASLAEKLNVLKLKQDQEKRYNTDKVSLNSQCEQVKMVIETNETKTKKYCLNKDSRVEIMRKLEEANEEVKQSKQALEKALNRVEIANSKQIEVEDEFRKWNIESWKDLKAIRPKQSWFLSQQNKPLVDLAKPMLKRNGSMGSVLNRKQNHTEDEKQLVKPKRKFRFIAL
ncbi:unnamed protein product [Cochlearia groenlandica]